MYWSRLGEELCWAERACDGGGVNWPSVKMTISSTQKTARARAMWPARRVWSSRDWALW